MLSKFWLSLGALTLQFKLTFNAVILNFALLTVATSLPMISFSEEVINATISSPSASAIESKSTTSVGAIDLERDKLSDTASVNLESIDFSTLKSSNHVSFATTDKTQTVNTLPSKINKDPFYQVNHYGKHSPVNYIMAAEQFCLEAREKNDADAQYALGWMYENGKGVIKDENIAVKFYSMAAKQFHQIARESLSASKGNPNIAKLPECMSKDFVPKEIDLSENSAEKAVNTKPFYVKGPIYKLVSKIAPRYQIDTDLVMAFIAVESGFDPNATSAKNAQGLMQLIPETAKRFKVKNAYDPEQNIKGGLAYLQWLLTYFEGDIALVAAAYNAGENTVDKYKGIPPYPETKKYVKKIATLYKKTHHPYQDKASSTLKSTIYKFSG